MKKTLLIIRHAIAEDPEEFRKTGQPDSQRPLTKEGKQKMKSVASWLKTQLRHERDKSTSNLADIIFESPLVRSQQTVDVLCDEIDIAQRVQIKELDPHTDPLDLFKMLDSYEWETAIIVGHQPHLSKCLAKLLKSDISTHIPFKFKKGGIAHLTVEGNILDFRVNLDWQITPKVIS